MNKLAAQLPVSIDIGSDTILPLKQSSPTNLTLSATIVGVPVSVLWTRLTGDNGVTIQLPSALSTPITGFKEGNYSFKCDVLNVLGISILSDVINIRVVDYQKKNRVPCRTGAPVTWTLSATNTVDLVKPYLRRDGMDIRGGDTIKINRNPNNGGVYNRFYLGDFGGDKGCPVVVVPNGQVVEIGGQAHRWHLGKNNNSPSDSNVVNHAVIDGTYLRDKGIQYGFQSTGSSWGLSATMVTDLELKGILFKNNSLGIQIKIYPDSAHGWTVYDNFIMKNIKIHDNYFQNMTGSEGLYIGHTSPSGESQANNDGPTPRMDSVFIYNNFIDSTGWDAMQVSSARYSEIHDNIILHSSMLHASSQNWGLLMGGNCTGKIYNNVVYSGTSATVGSLGYGPMDIYYNFIDSTTGTGMYFNGVTTGMLEASIPGMLPPLKLNIRNNIISRFATVAIQHANNDRRAQPGVIQDNYIVDPVKSLSQVITTNAGDAISNNTLIRSFPVTVRNIGGPGTGVLIRVTQGTEAATFSKAKDAIDWLFGRISGRTVPNIPPVAIAGNDQTITLPVNSVNLAGTGTDADGTIVSYLWTKIAGPSQFTIVSSSNSQTVANNLVQGVYKFSFQVTDNLGAGNVDTVTITVNATTVPPNIPPVANAGNDIAITLPINNVTLSGSSTDADGTVVSYNWTKIAGPAQFGITNPLSPQTTVTGLVAGVYQFRLQVQDNGSAQDADTVTVTVHTVTIPPNIPPVANAGNDNFITLPVNSTILYSTSTDPDGLIVSYRWLKIAGPVELIFANPTLSQTSVTGLIQGTYSFELMVTDDDGATDRDTVIVRVNTAGNRLPLVNAGSDKLVNLPTTVTDLQGTANDTDGSIVSSVWKIISGRQCRLSSPSSLQTAVTNLSEGTYQFELRVMDNSGATASDTVQVTVKTSVSRATVYPNPANNTGIINLKIEANTIANQTSLAIYDVSRRVVHREKFMRTQPIVIHQLNISRLAAGLYTIVVTLDNKHSLSCKFVKR